MLYVRIGFDIGYRIGGYIMDEFKRKRAIAGVNQTFQGDYDPIDDMSPEVKSKITQMPYAEQNGAIETEIGNSGPYAQLMHMIKSGIYGNKRNSN